MKADHFRFVDWNYMDMPANACERRKVIIEFVNTADSLVSQVEFAFDQGRVTSAKGWERLFVSGPLPLPSPVVDVR
jgi:hypothetical protein